MSQPKLEQAASYFELSLKPSDLLTASHSKWCSVARNTSSTSYSAKVLRNDSNMYINAFYPSAMLPYLEIYNHCRQYQSV